MSTDMLDEQLEFSISQYVDGALPDAEQRALEARLATDIDARAVLAEYRRLDAKLRNTPAAIPNLQWDALAEHLSASIDREERDRLLLPIGNARPRSRFRIVPLAAAAAFVLASGVALLILKQSTPLSVTRQPAPAPAQVSAVVEGPKAEVSSGPSQTLVQIGPAVSVDPEVQFAESIVNRPSRVVWIASGAEDVQDREPTPY